MNKSKLASSVNAEICDLYCTQGLSAASIGSRFGVCYTTILNRLTALGIAHKKHGCPGATNGHWRGGRQKYIGGYIRIWLAETDPFYCMADHHGTVFEHRLVMARFLGRPLERGEVVHHINGIRDDNRLENLELIASQKGHLPSMLMQQRIAELEQQVRLLKWQVKELHVQLERSGVR